MNKTLHFIVLITGILMVIFSWEYVFETEKEINKFEYKGNEGKSASTTNFKMIGAKRFGADMYWIKQVLDVGGHHTSLNEIKANSEKMSYLNPYFVRNYYFSGGIIGFIRTYQNFEVSIEILKRGIDYNPDDKTLLWYMSGMVAHSKGDNEKVLIEFEKIIQDYYDATVINIVAFLYETKYKKTGDEEYLKKAAYYWVKLLEAKEENYVKIGEEQLEEYRAIIDSWQNR